MTVKQVHELVNTATQEVLGGSVVVNENLSNVVDIGTELVNARAVDNYVRTLIDHIGKVIFVNRPYTGGAPNVLMDGWEFGSILEKIQADIPVATENESWELQDGQSYDPNIFYKPKVSALFFNDRVTFEIPQSITEEQVKSSFSNATQLNGFVSMLYSNVEKAMTIKLDALIMRTINNMIGETLYDAFPSGTYSGNSTTRAVNLLHLYNAAYPNATLTAETALTDPNFIRYAAYIIDKYPSRMSHASELFNIGGKTRYTSDDMLHVVMLADFQSAAKIYLQSDTFHDDLVALPNAETVPYWQGSGTDYGFGSISEINITTASGHAVEASGILAVMFDRDALGVANLERRVTSNYNPKAEFFNNWYKMTAGYFNDLNENFVVFYVE